MNDAPGQPPAIAPVDPAARAGPARLLVLPANRGGSVQHFYHFLFGYMLPFLEHCHPMRATHRFLLRDCGPMNALLREVPGFRIDFVPVNLALSSAIAANPADGAVPRLIVPGFDLPSAYERARFLRIRAVMQALGGERIAAAQAARAATRSDRLVLVVDRAPPLPFYGSAASESRGGGASRRSVPNMAEIAAAISERWETLTVRLEEMDLFAQIAVFARAWRVVGQHGAGLAHMIWARPEAGLVEILPNPAGVPLPRIENVGYFRGVCEKLGLPWRPVIQDGPHAAVSPAAVVEALAASA